MVFIVGRKLAGSSAAVLAVTLGVHTTRHRAHYVVVRKCITAEPSHDHNQLAQKLVKFGRVVSEIPSRQTDRQTDRQTKRHTHHSALHSSMSEVTIYTLYVRIPVFSTQHNLTHISAQIYKHGAGCHNS